MSTSPRARRAAGRPMLLRVFVVNVLVLAIAAVVLALSPATVSSPIVLAEAAALLVGFVLLVLGNFVLLRREFAGLRELTDSMARVDLMRPGLRVPVSGQNQEVAQLSDAFNAMLERLESERRQSVRAALGAQENERRRVAQELHDEIGQSLTAISLRLDAAMRQPGGASSEDLEKVRAIAAGSVDEVREIARRLRPEMLDDLGLVSALVALTERVADDSGITVRRRLERDLPELGQEADLVAFRVAQESLTNVIRHAGARSVDVRLTRVDGGVVLEVEDDGRGTDAGFTAGTGISGMVERAVLIGAELDITSAPGSGTRVTLRIPADALPAATA